MLHKSKLLAGVAAAGAVVFGTGAFAGDTGKTVVNGKGAVYGDIRWSLNSADRDAGLSSPSFETATNNNSYYGIKASTEGRGLTLFGVYEKTLDNDGAGTDSTRQGYVGLKSDAFGTLKYGQFATAYFESGHKLDPFANTAVAGVVGPTAPGATFNSHGTSALTNEVAGLAFIDNQIAYTTPSFGGLTANAALFVEDANATGQDHDYALGVEFSNAGITLGIQALDINNPANFVGVGSGVETQRLYGGLNVASFGINASLEKASLPGADADFAFVSGWFGVTTATRIAVALGHENNATGGFAADEGDSVSLGVFHDLMDNFTGWVAARRFDGKSTNSGVQDDVITVGASYKFRLGIGS